MPSRVFLAIELPAATRDIVARAATALLAADEAWAGEKRVDRELLHITVAFLGDVPDDTVAAVIGRLRGSASRTPPFELRLSGVRAVPSRAHASMVWVTLGGAVEEAASLAAALTAAAGRVPDARPFRPHVTIARARATRPLRPSAADAAAAVLSDVGREPGRFVSVRSVTVFSSTLGRTGPTYERLACLPLGGEGGPVSAR